jgi:hypothetical protein
MSGHSHGLIDFLFSPIPGFFTAWVIVAIVNALVRLWTNRIKTHCPRGHSYSGKNLIVRNGFRKCRECRNSRRRELQQKTPRKVSQNPTVETHKH